MNKISTQGAVICRIFLRACLFAGSAYRTTLHYTKFPMRINPVPDVFLRANHFLLSCSLPLSAFLFASDFPSRPLFSCPFHCNFPFLFFVFLLSFYCFPPPLLSVPLLQFLSPWGGAQSKNPPKIKTDTTRVPVCRHLGGHLLGSATIIFVKCGG